jgi:hypothetical protein
VRIIDIKIKNFGLWAAVLICGFWIFGLSGCIQKDVLSKAQDHVQQSQVNYQMAVAEYKQLIAKGKELDKLYFELGKLYYSHGELDQAIGAFKNSRALEAKKFLAISQYRLGNFTDAFEIFSRNAQTDDESLYYCGLTCEELNLYDQALSIYRKIKEEQFKAKALSRIDLIEKQANLASIQDISPRVSEILNTAPSAQEYPQAGALILFCDEKVEVSNQGTQVSTLHYVVKILNERGKEDFSETHISYDSTYEKVELDYARTIKPDGTVTEVGSRHIRDVSKYLNFPLYSNARVYIISFPEITEGASIEYKVKIYRHQLINKKDFMISYPVQAGEPIIAASFGLTVPKAMPVHIKILNEKYNNFGANLNPEIKEQDDIVVYLWKFKNTPQIIPEPSMPGQVEINPTMLISTFNAWQDIYSWWWSLAQDKIKPDTAIKDKVQELIKNQPSEEAKIRAIYNFCAQKIRYVAVEYGQAGYEPHQAELIFRNKYGDCKDQAILLVTMLKEAGFLAWPVLIGTKGYYNLNEDFPSMLFDHCIAAVALEDKVVFLDPTAETCSFGDLPADDQGRKVLLFREDKYEIKEIPLYEARHNLIEQQLYLKVNSDETISAAKTVFTYGNYDQAQRFWLLYTPPELIQEALKQKIQDISIGAKLDKYEIKNLENLNQPIVLSYSFNGPEYFTIAGKLRIMPQLASLDTSWVAKDERKYPIDFNILDSKEILLEIEIPRDFSVKYIPESVSQDSPWLKFIVEYSQKGNKIYFKQSSKVKKSTVSQIEYPEFKNFFESLAKKTKQRIVLEKIKQR